MSSLQGVASGCGCGDLHRVDCAATAAGQPNAMVNDDGDVFYPDGPEDAAYFAEHHGARPPEAGEWVTYRHVGQIAEAYVYRALPSPVCGEPCRPVECQPVAEGSMSSVHVLTDLDADLGVEVWQRAPDGKWTYWALRPEGSLSVSPTGGPS